MRKRNESASPDNAAQSSQASAAGSNGENGYDRDRVATRAYELWLQRGGVDGGDFDDWIAAERELTAHGSPGEQGE